MTTPHPQQPPTGSVASAADTPTDEQVEALAVELETHWSDWGSPCESDDLVNETRMAFGCKRAAAALRSLLAENRRMREALQIQQDESDLQMQGYTLCDDPNHPLFVKWLGPAKEGDTGLERHRQMSALRRSLRMAALTPPSATAQGEPR